jgi:hypothetical protein
MAVLRQPELELLACGIIDPRWVVRLAADLKWVRA